jgi:hypothetical protein
MTASASSLSFTDAELRAVISATPDLKQTTKGPYIFNLNTISRICSPMTLFDVIKDPVGGFKKMQDASKSIATLRTLLKTLLALMKYAGIKENMYPLYKPWYSHFIDASHQVNKIADNNVATPATELTWKQVLDKRATLVPGTIEHMTIAMYTMIPPRRQHDYWKMTLGPEPLPGSTGHMDIFANPPTMTVTAFKTQDVYKDYTATLPSDLVGAIRAYIKENASPQYLFTKRDGSPYGTLASFTDANNKVIKRALDYKFACVNTLRHAAATWVSTNPNMLRSTKKMWAHSMGHSLSMQASYQVVHDLEGQE